MRNVFECYPAGAISSGRRSERIIHRVIYGDLSFVVLFGTRAFKPPRKRADNNPFVGLLSEIVNYISDN